MYIIFFLFNYAIYSIQALEAPTLNTNIVGNHIEVSKVWTLFCRSTNAASWEWRKDGKLLAGKTTDQLEMNPVELSDGGAYTCTIKANNETATSQPYTLTVYSMSVTLEIDNEEVNEGENKALTCTLTEEGLAGTAEYTFYRDDTVIKEPSENHLHLIQSASTNDTSTNYKCSVTKDTITGTSNQKSLLVLVDECTKGTDNCHDNATCTDTKQSFTCQCKEGTTGNGTHCKEILITPTLTITNNNIATDAVTSGRNVLMECKTTMANASDEVTYEFFKDGQSVKPASTLEIYQITNANTGHTGSYHCVAAIKTKGQEKSSLKKQLTVSFTITIADKTVKEGETATFACATPAVETVKSYAWTKTTAPSTVIETIENLMFLPAKRTDDGTYQCEVTTESGAKVSAQAKLIVQYLDVPVLHTNKNTLVEHVDLLTLNCIADGNPKPLTFQIRKDDTLVSESNTFGKQKVNRTDSGNYMCRSTNADKSMSKESTPVEITVYYIDTPTLSQEPLDVKEGEALKLFCHSNPKSSKFPPSSTLKYVWYKDGEEITGANDLALLFSSATSANDGTFSCKAKAGSIESQLSKEITIKVKFGPGEISFTPDEASVKLNSLSTTSYYVNCFVTNQGYPLSKLKWLKVAGGTTSVIAQSATSNVMLSLSPLTRETTATYTCQASNDVATTSKELNITVLEKPDAPVVSLVKTMSAWSVIAWTAPFDGNSPIVNYTITLVRNSNQIRTKHTTGATELTYNVTSLMPAESYTVTVVAVNALGSGRESNELQLFTGESVPTKPRNLTITNSVQEELKLTWMEPSPTNGEILYYQVCATLRKIDLTVVNTASRHCNPVGNILEFNIENLLNYSLYTVEVMAKNSKGYGPPITLDMRTREVEPTEVRALGILSRPFANYILAKWSPPEHLYGEFKQYTVKYKRSNLPNNDFQSACENPPPRTADSTVECEITRLKPVTEYTICVTVINNADYRREICINMTTDPTAPPPFTGTLPAVEDADVTETKFPISLPVFDETNGAIKHYDIIARKLTSAKLPLDNPQTVSNKDISNGVSGMYVAGRVTDRNNKFVLGSGSTSKKKRRKRRALADPSNPALEEDTYYTVFVRVYVTETIFQTTNYYTPVKTKSSAVSGGLIAAVVIVILLLIAILALIAFWYRKRRQNPGEGKVENGMSQHKRTLKGLSPVGLDLSAPVDKRSFEDHVNRLKANGNYQFSHEYGTINRDLVHPYSHSRLQENNLKNRYHNVPAYDQTRVMLDVIDGDPTSDYINANYVQGYESKQEYVATQGPLPETLFEFWRMCWETESATIVMLTQVEERGRTKCAQYWPSTGAMSVKDIVITGTEVHEFPDHVVRTFHVTRTGQAVERIIKQFHFTAWPDFGVPDDPSALLAFMRKVNNWKDSNAVNRAVIHCSAGVGRTGTYITIDTQIKQIKQKQEITIYDNVTRIREQRCLLVQTEDQYIFIHYAVLDHIESGETEIEANELREYLRALSQVAPGSGMTGLTDEFVKLAQKAEKREQFVEANKPVNQPKNRYKNVYPYDDTRVKLSTRAGVEGSDYINANYIDSYAVKNYFIATQAPLESTVGDFWRMTWEQTCGTVVMLTKEKEGGQPKAYPYWPGLKASMKIEHFIIELVLETTFGDYVVRELKLTNTETSSSRDVKHFQYTTWPEGNVSPETGVGLVELIGQVQKCNTQNKSIVVHCSAGVGRTGVFIALTNLIERVKTEALVDVYQTIKKMRQQRTAMVQTKDQYEFCYRALQEYLDSFDLYANFR